MLAGGPKLKILLGTYLWEKKMSQLLSGTLCKQQKSKTDPSWLKFYLPYAYSQWILLKKDVEVSLAFQLNPFAV